MSRPRSLQEFVHWLEIGRGAVWVRGAAAVLGVLVLSFWFSWTQFRGATSEATLRQADTARQLAAGHGFTTLVNYPQTAAVLAARGTAFDPATPYPELYHAPLYSLTIAGALRLLPASWRARLFAPPAAPTDGFGGDYLLLGLNLVFFWGAVWLTFDVGRRLFDDRTGWLAALALLLALTVWQHVVAVDGTVLLMVLALAVFRVLIAIERAETTSELRPQWALLLALGVGGGLMFLTEYAAGAITLVLLGYVGGRFGGRVRWLALGAVAMGFLAVTTPWMVRNVTLTGIPVGLAVQDVALKSGDPTAEPSAFRAILSAELRTLDLDKLGNKTLTSLQESLRAGVWSGGAMWLAAFFVAGWLYAFRSATVNRLRWVFSAALVGLLIVQAAASSGESARPVVVWLAPLMIVFGAGFFFVLLGSHAELGRWPRLCAGVLLVVQALPLAHDLLAPPPAVRFQYPPYYPGLFSGMRRELEGRDRAGRFGVMADVPAGVAWYGGLRVWAQPGRLRDFYAIHLEQPVGELLLTPRTLDRPFFSELATRPVGPDSLGRVANRFGEWGGIYAGLLTGGLPREFPLSAPQRLAENLYVLLNPALPPARGK